MSDQSTLLDPINSIIGEDASFSGEFVLQGSLRIDGEFTGKIVSKGKVIVGPHGHVKTNIKARQVVVAGKVDGNIYALESVRLLENANVTGDIISSNLLLDEGVIFEGRANIRKLLNEEEFYENNR